jgi:hypothetical protein
VSEDVEHWRIRALTAEHLLEHERGEIERLLDYAAELEEKLGEAEPMPMPMPMPMPAGRFLVMMSKADAMMEDEEFRRLMKEVRWGYESGPTYRVSAPRLRIKPESSTPPQIKDHAQFVRDPYKKEKWRW